MNAAAASDFYVLQRTIVGGHKTGCAHHGAPQCRAVLHIAVAEGLDLDVFDDTTVADVNVTLVAVGGRSESYTGRVTAILDDQLSSLNRDVRYASVGGNIHAGIKLDRGIRDRCTAADKQSTVAVYRNGVNVLTVIENARFSIINANIVQFDPTDRPVLLECESVQLAAGLHLIDPGALSFKNINGIRRFDEQILEDHVFGEDMRFIERETVQFAARVHGNVFNVFHGYQVSTGIHFDIRRLSACLDMQHRPGVDRCAVSRPAGIHIVVTSVIQYGIAHDTAFEDMELSVSAERNTVYGTAIGNINRSRFIPFTPVIHYGIVDGRAIQNRNGTARGDLNIVDDAAGGQYQVAPFDHSVVRHAVLTDYHMRKTHVPPFTPLGTADDSTVHDPAINIKIAVLFDRDVISRSAGQNRHASSGLDRGVAGQDTAGHSEFYPRFHDKTGKHVVLQFECLAVVFPLQAGFRGNSQIELRAG